MKKYKETLNLPKTEFPIKASVEREVELLKKWEDEKLYDKIQLSRSESRKFTLHDGPPYANGHLHHGHILNKVLKDIIVKYNNLLGHKAEFVPGWDCHGLPIETQVDKELGPSRHQMSKLDLRKAYREYAAKFVNIQREEFKRLGVLADWDNAYQTMHPKYEAQTLRELGKFSAAGLLYRDYKPVYWCPNHLTALSNNDIGHKEDHVSTAVYVMFPMRGFRATHIAVWTTTPWTLSVNKAIAYNENATYNLFKVGEKCIWIAQDRAQAFLNKVGLTNAELIDTKLGKEAFSLDTNCHLYWNQLANKAMRLIHSDHVTTDTGTGFVHIAPAHGEDDFKLGKKYDLKVESAINDNGKSDNGLKVDELSKSVIEACEDNGLLLHSESYTHKYPYSTRSHKPVITRATYQWFVDIDKPYNNGKSLRQRALDTLDEVKWLPEHGYNRIKAMLESRPDWCLSRQRTWGVPIPAWKCSQCDFANLDPLRFEVLAGSAELYGSDIWFGAEISTDIAGVDELCPKCSTPLVQETDILDVWFDSGVSNAAVMNGQQVDLYLEGSDQHRGWFQSTLLAALGANETIPYKTVLTHGFVVDEKGEKLAKSKGNYVDPFKLIAKDGAELLRLWVAASDYKVDIKVSQQILDGVKQTQHKIRNTVRYMVASLSDFGNNMDRVLELNRLDRYILDLWHVAYDDCMKAYAEYNFHKVVRTVENFCVNDLSTFYFDVIKDSMYCDGTNAKDRRSTQTVLYNIASEMIPLMAPIMSFSMEDAWTHLGEKGSVHNTFLPAQVFGFDKWNVDCYNKLRELKHLVNIELEKLRDRKEIGAGIDANVTVTFPLDWLDFAWNHRLLAKLFGVSNVVIRPDAEVTAVAEKAGGTQCQRCWQYVIGVGSCEPADVCERCAEALKGLNNA
jgi:isoleucyl-tRNA synthetase